MYGHNPEVGADTLNPKPLKCPKKSCTSLDAGISPGILDTRRQCAASGRRCWPHWTTSAPSPASFSAAELGATDLQWHWLAGSGRSRWQGFSTLVPEMFLDQLFFLLTRIPTSRLLQAFRWRDAVGLISERRPIAEPPCKREYYFLSFFFGWSFVRVLNA